jgi:RNA polymerase sigma-B factor
MTSTGGSSGGCGNAVPAENHDASSQEADAEGPDRPAEGRERPAIDERFRRYRETGDRKLRNELIEDHRWVAVHCARRFDHRGEPLDDLVQVGLLGLLKSVERFDPDVGVSFASYAIPTILGELRRHFRDATWALKVPRRVKDLHVEIGSAVEHLSETTGGPPTPRALADHLGVSVDEVLEALDAGSAYRPSSLSAGGSGDAGDADSGRRAGGDQRALRVDDAVLEGADERLLVRTLLARLPERERTIVALRFYEGLSQGEIAERVGVSQVHVSRLLRASLAQLQRFASEA